ncbi:MAG: dicarboxylate/amino acid:cation symporter [Myxococcales bacterium]
MNRESAGESELQGTTTRFPLYAQILLGMLLGLLAGPVLGAQALVLGTLGKIVVQLIKAAATPLLFFAIVQAVLTAEIRGRAALRLLFFATLNASIALAIGLSLSNFFLPGRSLARFSPPSSTALASYTGKKIDLLATLESFVPSNFVSPFAENSVLTIVLIALLLGFGLRRAKSEQLRSGAEGYRVVEGAVNTLYRVLELVLGWVIRLVPFAVFGVVAKAVGEHGYAPLKGLAVYVAVGVGGLVVHVVVTYQAWLVLFARMPLRRFWKEAREPVAYALGANSSLATLPVTLRALDRLGVPRSASTLGACVGTNFNNDGIILYEGMAVLFVAQASGIHVSVAEQLLVAGACLVAAMGVAGVPEAGFVSLALVLNTVKLPLELLPLLLTVDWIIARGRSAVNVLSDMLLSILLAKSEERAP